MATPRPKALVAWSSGKDSAWSLHKVREAGELDVVGLLTTITRDFGRVSMHGVREEVLEAQAAAAGLPLHKVFIHAGITDDEYSDIMRRSLDEVVAEGVTCVVHGDLYLEGIREWRESKLAEAGLTAQFPLWGRDTAELVREMIRGGVVARATCLDPRKIPRGLAGAVVDEDFLAKLPPEIDPCAENGEFHTCVVAGPFFEAPIDVKVGETVEREGFVFTDIELAGPA